MIRAEGQLLFYGEGELRGLFEARYAAIQKEINGYGKEYIVSVDEKKLKGYLETKYSFQIPIIDKETITVDEAVETYIDHYKGFSVVIHVPFTGDSQLLLLQPSTSTNNPPRGEVKRDEILLRFSTTISDPELLKGEYGQILNQIVQYLGWVKKDVDKFNLSLSDTINQTIIARKNRLNVADLLTKGLGIRLRKREDIPDTYKVPELKKQPRIKINRPIAPKKDPEPILEESEYENILKIIFNMAITMERSPKTFIKLEEEEIRDHFLIHLNGHYEGLATGETFNCEGKTDILIRYNGKNIFIAECKIWRGKKYFEAAIDQLLSYTSWRDTKTAILIFNKNKNFSQVLSHIEPSVISHANYLNKRRLKEKILSNESVFAYNYCHKDDSQKELILSVMAFNIPQIG